MATVTKTFVENGAVNYKATWTVSATSSDLMVSGSFVYPLTATAKYVYTGKDTAYADLRSKLTFTGTGYSKSMELVQLTTSWASGTTRSLPISSNDNTISVGSLFNSNNPNVRTVDIELSATFDASSYKKDTPYDTLYNYYDGPEEREVWSTKIGTVTLNTPPTATLGTPSYSSPQYAGLGVYTVDVTTSSAQYGGTIQSITLTIGSQTDTKNFSATTVTNQTFTLTPAVAGTFTPTITIADSRGQTTVKSLPQITVNAYTAPSMSFDLARCDVDGIPQAEGEYGLVTANITYVDAIAELTQPTVSVKDSSDSTIISSTTWYETWDAVNGVRDAVNWTDYNPTSPVTLYAIVSATGSEFSPNESYTVSITPTDNMGGVAQTITQTLATGFFTIDFQAGGKEIAFGAPANDTLTQKQEQIGLFKCAMDTNFNDMTSQEVDAFVASLNCNGGSFVQAGQTDAITVTAGSYADRSVTFNSAYSNLPIVVVGFLSSSTAGAFGKCCVAVNNRSVSGFNVRIFNGDTADRAPAVQWIAFGN